MLLEICNFSLEKAVFIQKFLSRCQWYISGTQWNDRTHWVQTEVQEIPIKHRKCFFHFESGQTLADCLEGLWSLYLWRYLEPDWMWLSATCSRWLSLEEGGLDYAISQRSNLNYSVNLWYCDPILGKKVHYISLNDFVHSRFKDVYMVLSCMILLGSEQPRQGGDVAATCCSLCKIKSEYSPKTKIHDSTGYFSICFLIPWSTLKGMCLSYMWDVFDVIKERSFMVHSVECSKSYWHLHNPETFGTPVSKADMFHLLPLVISLSPEFELQNLSGLLRILIPAHTHHRLGNFSNASRGKNSTYFPHSFVSNCILLTKLFKSQWKCN